MGFFDFTILADGKIKINGVWSSPKKESTNRIFKKKKPVKTKYGGVSKGEVREL